jgi:hypothetical protein
MEECVVTFNNGKRKISMYFSDNAGNLEMQMSVEPEFKDGEEPDLAMLLASTFMNALNTEDNKENESKIIVS